MAIFTVGGHDYQSSRMDAITQMKVARRLTPLYTKLVEAAQASADKDDEDVSKAFISTFTAAVGEIDDEAIDFITDACLSRCQRKAASGSGWLPVWTKTGPGKGQLQFALDTNGMEVISICAKVIQEELGGFFPASPNTSPSPA